MTTSNEDAPGKKYFTPTQADSGTDAAGPFRAIYVGTAGNLKITDFYGNAVTFTNVSAGLWPFGGVLVWSTGTTASGLVCVSANDHLN